MTTGRSGAGTSGRQGGAAAAASSRSFASRRLARLARCATALVLAAFGATVEAQTDATLRSLQLFVSADFNLIALSPSFSSSETTYTAEVAASVGRISIWPQTTDSNADWEVQDGDGIPLENLIADTTVFDVALGYGDNVLRVVVTAEDTTTTETYTVTVRRTPLGTDATLSGLALEDEDGNTIDLSPPFSSSETTYTAAKVEPGVEVIVIAPTRNATTATWVIQDGNGDTLDDWNEDTDAFEVELVPGDNEIRVVVTAEDITITRTYTVTVRRTVWPPEAFGTPRISTSLDVRWQRNPVGADDFDVRYRLYGTTDSFTDGPQDQPPSVNSTDPDAIITGLMANTLYEVQMRATYGTVKGDWSLSRIARTHPPEAEVPSIWGLVPEGLADGAKFRLLYLSSELVAGSNGLEWYNDQVVQWANEEGSVQGHPDIQPYASGFRVVGCGFGILGDGVVITPSAIRGRLDTDARMNADIETFRIDDPGAPIYWLGGKIVADRYSRFLQKSLIAGHQGGPRAWTNQDDPRDERGNASSYNRVWVGCRGDGYRHAFVLWFGGPLGYVATGKLTDAEANPDTEGVVDLADSDQLAALEGPVSQLAAYSELVDEFGEAPNPFEEAFAVKADSELPVYALSQVFVVRDPPVVALVKNTGQDDGLDTTSVGLLSAVKAQGFRTGKDRYVLSSVELRLGGVAGSDAATVSIYGEDASGDPGTSLHPLTNDSIANGANTFTAPLQAALEPETNYFVVVEASAGDFTVGRTSSLAEDAGAADGWSIFDGSTFTDNNNTDWTENSKPLRIAVRGGVVVVDNDPPRVESIEFEKPTSFRTNEDTLTWRVTFSEDVENVDATDFAVSGTTAGLSVVEDTASTEFLVTASGGDLAGGNLFVTLSFVAGQNIEDEAGNALADTEPTGDNEDTYIVDNRPPEVVITVPDKSAENFEATFVFTEDVTGFARADIKVRNGTASNFRGSGGRYAADIWRQPYSNVTLEVAADAAKDAAGNGNTAARVTSEYTSPPNRNSAPVFFEGANTTRSVVEDAAPGTNIGRPVKAVDVDNDTLTYTLAGTDAGSFGIDPATGQLRTSAALDRETKDRYSVRVKVDDGEDGTDTIAVTIDVVEAAPPECNMSMAPVTVYEGETARFTVAISPPLAREDTLNWYIAPHGEARFPEDICSRGRFVDLPPGSNRIADRLAGLPAGATAFTGEVETCVDDEEEQTERFQIMMKWDSWNQRPDWRGILPCVGVVYIRDGPRPAAANPSARVVGDLLTLSYAEPLDAGSTPGPKDWVVRAQTETGARALAVTGVSVSGAEVALALSPPVAAGESVSVSYLPWAMHPLLGVDGAEAPPLTELDVRNETPAFAPVDAPRVAGDAPGAAAPEDEVAARRGPVPPPLSTLAQASSKRLDLPDLGLTDVAELAGLADLEALDLSGNAVADVWPLAGLARLRRLNLSDNRIAELSALAELSRLEVLDLSGNAVADAWPLAGLVELRRLDLSGNRLGDVAALAGLAKLEVLVLDGNRVTDALPIALLPRLARLDLSGNRVADAVLLAELRSLARLDLSGNRVADASPLGDLSRLVWLDLTGNPVSDVAPLGRLTALRWLWLDARVSGLGALAPLRVRPAPVRIERRAPDGSVRTGDEAEADADATW